MNFILKLLGGSLGPYLLGGVGVLLALSMATAGVQGLRLKHAKADLSTARAALINPVTRKTWQSEAVRDARDLGACKSAVAEQNASVAAAAAETARKLAAATKGQADARAVAESYRQTAPAVRAYQPKGADSCARTADVARMIREDLRR